MRASGWFRWILANALGGSVGSALAATLAATTFGFACGPLVGLGLGQWLARCRARRGPGGHRTDRRVAGVDGRRGA